ncbi:hypothetical protein NDU88_009079 [Pleurodeles waltl]|uniref:Uncharacterized protein n=1 Tax=Pleurodeles waltl TaxID=8319 RepID=A0AAV7QTR1_PLEWA|nr:hypothetical protein NDU88_009079 [Pleurodeles waltl]
MLARETLHGFSIAEWQACFLIYTGLHQAAGCVVTILDLVPLYMTLYRACSVIQSLATSGERRASGGDACLSCRKREDLTRTEEHGAPRGEEEMRGHIGGEDGKEDVTESNWRGEDHPEESEAREEPSAGSGHA